MFVSGTGSSNPLAAPFSTGQPNAQRAPTGSSPFVQMFHDIMAQQSAPKKSNSRRNVAQVASESENQECAKVAVLRNLKAKAGANLSDGSNKTEKGRHKHTNFQKYYKQVKTATQALAQELGIEIKSTIMQDPTHELPDMEMLAPVPRDLEKLRTAYSLIKKEIACRIGDVGDPFGELTNNATNDLQLYTDSISIYRSFFRLVNHLAAGVKGKACFGPDDELQIIKGEESFIRKIKADTVDRIKEIIKVSHDLPSPDVYAAMIDHANKETIKNLSDVVRGTIIVDSIEQMQSLIKNVNYMAQNSVYIRGIKIKNIYGEAEARPDGYASVHAKVLIAYEDDTGKMQSLLTEIQFQFSSFFNGTHLCPKELTHLIMDYHRKIISGKLQMQAYDKASADAASMLQALLAMKTLKQSIPEVQGSSNEMVAIRNPIKHLLTFLSPHDSANLGLTCRSLRLAQAVAKILPTMVPSSSVQNGWSVTSLYPINKHMEVVPSFSTVPNIEYMISKRTTLGLRIGGIAVGLRLGYVAGIKVTGMVGQLISKFSGRGVGPEYRAACLIAVYAIGFGFTYIGSEWGFFLGNKLGKPDNLCLRKLLVVVNFVKNTVNRVINPNSINMVHSQDRSIVVTTFTHLGRASGTLGALVGLYVGREAAKGAVNQFGALVGPEVWQQIMKESKEPGKFTTRLMAAKLVWLTSLIECTLFGGYLGRRLGANVGEAAGSYLNQVKPFRRALVSTARALRDGYSPESSRFVTAITVIGKLAGSFFGVRYFWRLFLLNSSKINNKIYKLNIPNGHRDANLRIFYLYLPNFLKGIYGVYYSGTGFVLGAHLGGKIGKFTGVQLYRGYHIAKQLKAYCLGQRW